MRQLITRIDDDLHARLKDIAQRQGRSVNALVVEALEHAAAQPVDQRAAVRRRAIELGLAVIPPTPANVLTRDEVIAASQGAGRAVSDALLTERDER